MENEKRLIDAIAYRKILQEEMDYLLEQSETKGFNTFKERMGLEIAIADLGDMPTVDAVEVVHGRWIRIPSSDMMTGKAYKCSECNKMRYGSFMPNYCQCCGAKMTEGSEGE